MILTSKKIIEMLHDLKNFTRTKKDATTGELIEVKGELNATNRITNFLDKLETLAIRDEQDQRIAELEKVNAELADKVGK